MAITKENWIGEQHWEQKWWEDNSVNCTLSFYEEWKQRYIYSKYMGLSFDNWERIDLQGKNVLDVGGGPVSMLLKCVNKGRCMVLDPLDFPEWVLKRYEAANIEFNKCMGEEMDESGWDEVWMYNVLQHVQDPEELLKRAMKAGKILRIFEWVDTSTSGGHPQSNSIDFFEKTLGRKCEKITVDSGKEWKAYAFAGSFDFSKPYQKIKRKDIKMRFHIPAIPHTVTNKQYVSCAYTQKVLKLSSMLTDLGYDVFHYGCEGSDVHCTENINVVTNEYRESFYPDNDDMSKQYTYNTDDEYHKTFHNKCVEEITKRLCGRDFFLASWGWGHKPQADMLGKKVLTVESGIGYPATFADFRVFESVAWQHYVYGSEKLANGKFFDAVIPNYFDINDFEYREEKEDWFLYLGRIVKRKGVELAVDVTKNIGAKLIIAGQGTLKNKNENLDIKGDHIEFFGHADVDQRKYLMSRAKGVFIPTYYIEPFGGVSIEAALSGTPVITTNYGAFAENVLNGVTGYRCQTLEQFEWAAKNIHNIKPINCREWAVNNFSMERVSQMYKEYFEMLYTLFDTGWPEKNEDRTELSWLDRKYPNF